MSIPEIQLVRNFLDKVRYICRQLKPSLAEYESDRDLFELIWKIDNWTESALNNLIDVDTYILHLEKDMNGLIEDWEREN